MNNKVKKEKKIKYENNRDKEERKKKITQNSVSTNPAAIAVA